MADHVHLLVRMPSTHSVADLARVIKTNSSRWLHEQWPQSKGFRWQTGHGAFSVSESGQDAVRGTSCTSNNITPGDRSRKSLLRFSRRTTSSSTKNICGLETSYAPSGWHLLQNFPTACAMGSIPTPLRGTLPLPKNPAV
jgi:hypothetical protein